VVKQRQYLRVLGIIVMREHNRDFRVINFRSSKSKVEPKEVSGIVCLPPHLQWQLDILLSREVRNEVIIAERLYDLLVLAMRHCGGFYYKVLIDEKPFITDVVSESPFTVSKLFVEIFLGDFFSRVEVIILLSNGIVDRPFGDLWNVGLEVNNKRDDKA